jgi:hypothetical protein
MLYMNNLEKYYKGIIFIATAPYMGADKTPNSVVQIEIADMAYFMYESHKTSNKYKLIKNKIYSKSGINTINQIGYLLVPPGFKMALSSPDNNRYGSKCTNKLRYPNSSKGACIPGNLRNFNSYLTGKHAIRSLMYHSSRTNKPTIIWKRPFPDTVDLGWLRQYDGIYLGRGRGNRIDYQKDFNWHTEIDSSIGSCWIGSSKPPSECHYAWGNIIFKHINVIADENFFNKFYATPSKREEIRNQFRMGNFNSLKGFF